MSRRPNDFAFPIWVPDDELAQMMAEDGMSTHGLTVREYYAAAALTGLLACLGQRTSPQAAALAAFGFADAMLAESAKGVGHA